MKKVKLYKIVFNIEPTTVETTHHLNPKIKQEGIIIADKSEYSSVSTNHEGYSYMSGFLAQNVSYRTRWNEERGNLLDVDFVKVNEQLIKNKAIYRYPKLTLPRQKIDVLKEKHGLKVIRDKEKSDFRVISNKFIEDLLQYTWTSYSDIESVKLLIKQLDKFLTDTSKLLLNDFIEYCDNQNDKESILICIEKNHTWNGEYNVITDQFDIKNVSGNVQIVKDPEALDYLTNANNLILDDDLMKLCNSDKDSITISDQEYHNLTQMMESGDKENIALAMEVMANCNIEKSLDKIALLFHFQEDIMRYSKSWNIINVKSLRKRMAKYPGNGDKTRMWRYDDLIKKLHDENMLTEFVFKIIAASIFNEVLQKASGFNDSAFEIDLKSIKLKKKFKLKEDIEEFADLPF